jgi:hypothetical protein
VAIVNGYTTLPEFKNWIGLTDEKDDIRFERAITAASRGIDNHCKRHFWQTAAGTTRVYDTCDKWWLDIDDAVSVTFVKTDDNMDGTFETTWAASDFQLLPLNPAAAPELEPFNQIKAVAGRTFPQPTGQSRLGLIQVTATWGWPAIPEAIGEACRLVVNRLCKRPGSPEGVAGFDEFGQIRISARDDPDAVRLLDHYWDPAKVGV